MNKGISYRYQHSRDMMDFIPEVIRLKVIMGMRNLKSSTMFILEEIQRENVMGMN